MILFISFHGSILQTRTDWSERKNLILLVFWDDFVTQFPSQLRHAFYLSPSQPTIFLLLIAFSSHPASKCSFASEIWEGREAEILKVANVFEYMLYWNSQSVKTTDCMISVLLLFNSLWEIFEMRHHQHSVLHRNPDGPERTKLANGFVFSVFQEHSLYHIYPTFYLHQRPSFLPIE